VTGFKINGRRTGGGTIGPRLIVSFGIGRQYGRSAAAVAGVAPVHGTTRFVATFGRPRPALTAPAAIAAAQAPENAALFSACSPAIARQAAPRHPVNAREPPCN